MSNTSMTASPDFAPAARSGTLQKLSRPSLSYWQDAWLRLKRNKQALVSLFLILFLLAFIAIGPKVWTLDPTSQDLTRVSEPPSLAKTATVVPDQIAWEQATDPAFQSTLDPAPTEALPAPAGFQIEPAASTVGVRLKWQSVPGAEAYVIYRSESPPTEKDRGFLITEVFGGENINYQDQFSLEERHYYYSIAAKFGAEIEPSNFASADVRLTPTLPLSAAQEIDANAKEGAIIQLPAHPMGTDYLGRDVLSRLMSGGAVSLGIGFFAPLLSTLIGVFIGGLAGFVGGRLDHWLMRFADLVLALPFLLFVILFQIAFGGGGAGQSGVAAMLVALVVLSWPGSARLTRGQVLQLRETEFVQASRLLGAKSIYLLVRHLLPNTLGVILVSLTFEIPRAIFTEAFLSFIGMGIKPPETSWGSMCDDGVKSFLTHPHEFFFPAIIISITVLAFNLLGDGLRDALDPRMRSSE